MRLESHLTNLLNEDVFSDALKKIQSKSSKSIEKFLKSNWDDFSHILQDKVLEDDALEIINRRLGTHYKTLKDIDYMKVMRFTEGVDLNEDFAHYWDLMRQEAFPSLAFYPALMVWLEFDKMLKANGTSTGSMKVVMVYAAIWLILITGKYIKSFRDWKKKNPEEYRKEKGLG